MKISVNVILISWDLNEKLILNNLKLADFIYIFVVLDSSTNCSVKIWFELIN